MSHGRCLKAMISTKLFVKKLREIGFSFHLQKKRVDIWKRPGDLSYVTVPRSDKMPKTEAEASLRMKGCASDEIAAFLADSE